MSFLRLLTPGAVCATAISVPFPSQSLFEAHALSSAPGLRAPLDMSPFAQPFKQLPVAYELGGGGPERARNPQNPPAFFRRHFCI